MYVGENSFRNKKVVHKVSEKRTLKKITGKITAQCAGKNNAYSLCCIFTAFCCKFQARVEKMAGKYKKYRTRALNIQRNIVKIQQRV